MVHVFLCQQNPVPKGPWHHLLDGKLEQEKMCAHKNLLKVNASIEGVEDCLYLAIFRPFVSLH